MITEIGFDADDTLWHCENHFFETQARLEAILEHHAPREEVEAKLHDTELANVRLFGYGIKGFTLSMIETAVQISRGKITGDEVHEILMMGKAMLDAPVELMPNVRTVLASLQDKYRLSLITKGDVLDQTNKIDKSGLGDFFDRIEVVQQKEVDNYRDVLTRHGIDAEHFLMIGNSIPSDVLPVLELGGWGVHVPYRHTAVFERHVDDPPHERFRRLESLSELPALLTKIEQEGAADR
ncbi:HAD family hydrolase [Hwanghaeella grinnelliae]|uniref:HAD family hydrolase n=1 Tax=Hwanghaeella grinnelliae TaxID=2500179 RepID=A0A3S2Z5C7_9PROT|nr:HAD family hydrolase [Hwanghaeella grinnelliae]RVU34208.1 HAD family hydrolase [Hwanghaeella grinnelliae]